MSNKMAKKQSIPGSVGLYAQFGPRFTAASFLCIIQAAVQKQTDATEQPYTNEARFSMKEFDEYKVKISALKSKLEARHGAQAQRGRLGVIGSRRKRPDASERPTTRRSAAENNQLQNKISGLKSSHRVGHLMNCARWPLRKTTKACCRA
jgi:hypothetical protein